MYVCMGASIFKYGINLPHFGIVFPMCFSDRVPKLYTAKITVHKCPTRRETNHLLNLSYPLKY